jgi:hypothetical protein
MAEAPVQPCALVSVHAVPCFLERRHWERRWEDWWWSRQRFLEYLMLSRHAAVLVPMAAPLTNILQGHQNLISALFFLTSFSNGHRACIVLASVLIGWYKGWTRIPASQAKLI